MKRMQSNFSVTLKLGIIITLFALMFSANKCHAQSKVIVNGTDINALDVSYIEVVVVDLGMFKKNIVVTIDYGQSVKPNDSQVIMGDDGKPMNFQSAIGAINFLADHGWKFLMAYPVSIPQSGQVYHYILERR